MYLLECYIEHPVRSIDRTFTYRSEEPVLPGVRVKVPFHHRTVLGFVEQVNVTEESIESLSKHFGYDVLPVEEVLDQEPLLNGELAGLAHHMHEETLSTVISCYQAMLPGKIKPAGKDSKVVEETWVKLSDEEVSLTPKELEAYCFVREEGEMRYHTLREHYPNQARNLIAKHALISFKKEREAAMRPVVTRTTGPVLTAEQNAAIQEIEQGADTVYLLHGQTGSGKTEVYLHLAENALKQGKQVLILVPEISLTPQMIERVSGRFGEELAIYHSGLNPQEKYEQYRMVKNGRAAVVVGTRSAVFLPFQSLGLIVMDEEQDGSYKQEVQPAYHCRDIAIYRANYHHCKCVLGSATPSLETYARALRNVYHLVTLKERVNRSLPNVTIVSMKEAMRHGQSPILSDELLERMNETLQNGKQVILLLNRRGFHTMLRCGSCGEPLKCRHCDITLSYHRDSRNLVCHSCGSSFPVPAVCPSCGARSGFSYSGYGTQRLEQEVKERFPDARVLRMDADTTSAHNAHERLLTSFGAHGADILLGTQMIAKGLDYPDVTLVGILNGDEGLNRTDYRSCEVTFDLLMQASGRSGRSASKGEVVLQAFDPSHYAVVTAAKQDYESFFQAEMRYRHAAQEPPYTYLISITLSDRKEPRMTETALKLYRALSSMEFRTIGVIPLPKRRDQYRSRILLKGKNLDQMRDTLRTVLENDADFKRQDIRIDVNPMTLE